MNPPSSPEEIFRRLLDESAALLAAPESADIAIPDDELHCEIIVPLLPAMLGDKAIREHWNEQAATGFVARLARATRKSIRVQQDQRRARARIARHHPQVSIPFE